MAKGTKKSAPKAAAKNTEKKATITQPAVKKEAAKPAPAAQPAAAAPAQPAQSKEFEKQKAAILKKYPNLTEDAFQRYDGEGDESVLRRAAERAGVSYEELIG